MFSGIVSGAFKLTKVSLEGTSHGQLSVVLPAELTTGLQQGASVAVDGVCLTVARIERDAVTFDVIQGTIDHTITSRYRCGASVNIERSLALGDENGGHEVSGHVDTTARVVSIIESPGNRCMTLEVSPRFSRYIFPQGFVSINGVSLTVCDCIEDGRLFVVWLIPETLHRTNLGVLSIGDHVNLEIHRGVQVVVDTIRECVTDFLNSALSKGTLTGEVIQAIAGVGINAQSRISTSGSKSPKLN